MDVINIIIAYGSKYCIAIVNELDREFALQGYSLNTFENVFKFAFSGTYIKMNQIE